MALGRWGARLIYVDKAIHHQLQMLADELSTFGEIETTTDEVAELILCEYVRQHFSESTKAAARLFQERYHA